MRTTVNIDEHLLSEAKKQALESGSTLNRVIEDALRKTLLTKKYIKKNKVSLVTAGRSGLRHGVNLDDNQSLLDIMDE
jgi:hypothetical protein